MKDFDVVIIGGNHHNTLSVIRCFAKKKVNFLLLIHDDSNDMKNMMIAHSKYSKNMVIINKNEKSIINWLLENKNESKKIIIIPCSDLAEFSIDKNYNKLNKYYYIPGFKDEPGKVCKLMNKYEQKMFADRNGIPMANSWLIDLNNKKLDGITYPCIIKPNVSAHGTKGDIRICNNKRELDNYLGDIYVNYESVIVQEFISKNYELLAMGYISDFGYKAGGVERKLRETIPGGGGSTAFGRFVIDSNIIESVNKVLKILFEDGYRGLYDIEFFECDNIIYLNEINFRHSGSGFALIANGINAPYLYYLDCKRIKYSNNHKLKHRRGYFLCDIGEINLLRKYKTINIFQFVFDFMRSYTHSIISIDDIGVFKFYLRNKR